LAYSLPLGAVISMRKEQVSAGEKSFDMSDDPRS